MENICNSTIFKIVLKVKKAVYPVYFTGTIAYPNTVHKKPRKGLRPGALAPPHHVSLRDAYTYQILVLCYI